MITIVINLFKIKKIFTYRKICLIPGCINTTNYNLKCYLAISWLKIDQMIQRNSIVKTLIMYTI